MVIDRTTTPTTVNLSILTCTRTLWFRWLVAAVARVVGLSLRVGQLTWLSSGTRLLVDRFGVLTVMWCSDRPIWVLCMLGRVTSVCLILAT